ncbi:PREDICTED: uncharacterized protein LOC101298676 [Fragaria vesca subsp. vesca]|uniref:uncharacterized protein LOC101298676 n=1 Tax=Fragaria vesca subsp. vesca TaxID=101020 RepID=UPI0002C3613B|nr:PREDICTED: uncharacterized protein LOC101298676 [Fragaria vesca subsp. vesca]
MGLTQREVNSILSMITVRLTESNFVKWSFQFQSMLEGGDLFGYYDGTNVCPPRYVLTEDGEVTAEVTEAFKEWKRADKALLGLLMATLDDEIMDVIVGSRSAKEAWSALIERFSTVSRANIMQLKTDLQTIKKGADNIDKYLLRIKHARDQLNSVGVSILDEDIIVVTLNGLPDEYAMIKTVIRARDTAIPLKDFRAQLLAAERDIEKQFDLSGVMSAMAAQNTSFRNNNFGTNQSNDGDKWKSSYNSNDKGKTTWNGGNGSKSGGWSNNSKFSQGESSGSFKGYNPVECQICGKKGHAANDCYQHLECSICHKKGHPASKCFQNPANTVAAEYRNNVGIPPECQICSKKGHTAVNCFYRVDILADHPSKSVVVCQICGLKGHVALDCQHRSNYAYQGAEPPTSLTAMTASTSNGGASSSTQSHSVDDIWIGNTGATHHMTSDLRTLSIAKPYESANTITIGNGSGQGLKGSSLQRKE